MDLKHIHLSPISMKKEKRKAMKKLLQNLLVGGVGVISLIACSVESIDQEMTALNASTSTMEVQDLSMNDLVGTWNMYSMTSSDSVDFDQNEVYTYDLLEETECFDPMYFIFDNEGNVVTEQARLYFSSTTGEFSCQTTGNYSATYQISGNELTVTFTVNGVQFTEAKTVSRYSENGEEFLQVTLTKQETDSAVYVSDDPGNTVASDIQQIDMVYIKVQ